jgi:guanylate kinase
MENASLLFDVYHPQPLLVVISGPSGVGKDAVVKAMQKRGQPFHFVVTMTSRGPRPGEVEGADYFFTTKENFEHMIAEGGFIEYAVVYQDYKGIPKEQIRRAFASDKDVILRVDVQGQRRCGDYVQRPF